MFFWQAYNELCNDRQSGMDIGSIPFSAMISYANEYRLTGRERECFMRVIRSVDNHWHTLMSAKRRKEMAKHK